MQKYKTSQQQQWLHFKKKRKILQKNILKSEEKPTTTKNFNSNELLQTGAQRNESKNSRACSHFSFAAASHNNKQTINKVICQLVTWLVGWLVTKTIYPKCPSLHLSLSFFLSLLSY